MFEFNEKSKARYLGSANSAGGLRTPQSPRIAGFFHFGTVAAMTYRIVNWDDNFENNRTRELKNLNWVPIPNKLDGDGYTELVDHQDGAAIYGAWIACVIVASKCDPRGTLLRAGNRDHDSASLSRISRLKAKWFDLMFERAITIGWIEVYENPALGCENPALGCLEQKGTEQKGTEQKGTEGKPVIDLSNFQPCLAESVASWLRYKTERRETYKPEGLKSFLTQITKASETYGSERVADALESAASNGHMGWKHEVEKNGKQQKTFDELKLERTAQVVRDFGNE